MEDKCCSGTRSWEITVKAPPAPPWEAILLGAIVGGMLLGGITSNYM